MAEDGSDEAAWMAVVAEARVARLGTHGPGGRIDLVPFVFAWLPGPGPLGTLVSAVDHKPKRHERLARLANVRRDPSVTVLVDHFAEDWSELWWARLVGEGIECAPGDPGHGEGIDALVAKYGAYQERRPTGPVLQIRIGGVRAWSASGRPPGGRPPDRPRQRRGVTETAVEAQ